jgi:hypothetical protein
MLHLPQLGGSRYRWGANIKINIESTGFQVMGRLHLTQGKFQWWILLNIIMNLRAKAEEFLIN